MIFLHMVSVEIICLFCLSCLSIIDIGSNRVKLKCLSFQKTEISILHYAYEIIANDFRDKITSTSIKLRVGGHEVRQD